jgi:hypothetical protein
MEQTYVCVSPLGLKNHATRLMQTTTTKPMMMLHLRAGSISQLDVRNNEGQSQDRQHRDEMPLKRAAGAGVGKLTR